MSETTPANQLSARGVLAAVLAWLLPGAGHLLLKRPGRAIAFFVIVVTSTVAGVILSGNLYTVVPGRPLSMLGTFAEMGVGVPYLLLRFVAGYSGDIVAPGYEYGTAFLVTAGLMNWLLVLDVWDIVLGRKD